MRKSKEKSALMELVELRNGGGTIEELIRAGIEAGKTQEEIARGMGISFFTLRSWM